MNIDWNGEGHPSVGTICEFEVETGEWRKCEVIAVKEDYVVCWIHVNKILATSGVSLRPVKTPEQIAEEERERGIEEMAKILGVVACDDYVAATALYDAGYRK